MSTISLKPTRTRRLAVLVIALAAAGLAFAYRRHSRAGAAEPAPPFRLGRVQAEDLQTTVREIGVVDPSTKVEVKANVSGRVAAIRVREGAAVKRGEVLAEVEPGVDQAQSLAAVAAKVGRAELSCGHAERDLERKAALFRTGIIPAQAFHEAQLERDLARKELEAARADYAIVEARGIPIGGGASARLARVVAPMDGIVIKRSVEPGDTITSGVNGLNGGTALLTLADLGSLIVRVNLHEVDIAKVQAGQAVNVSLDAYPQRTFPGRVRFVAPAAEVVEKLKVFKIEVALDRQAEVLRPGMSANVEMLGERRPQALSVPLEALQRSDGQTVVYRFRQGLPPKAMATAREELAGRSRLVWLADHWRDYFERVPVRAGMATLERVEILGGLAKDDQVCLEDPTRKRVETDDSF